MARVVLDPISRIEGHLAIEIDVQNGVVKDAKSKGDMFRGFERILTGRNPVDANQITQRICGVCPVSHGLASSKCLDAAFNVRPNRNGRLERNLVLAANYLQSHILHFYHLAALDYVDITAILKYEGGDAGLSGVKAWAKEELKLKKDRIDQISAVGPFLPRYEGENFYIKNNDLNIAAIAHYLQAFDIRMKAHKMVAAFGGRAPHLIGLVPGGVTQVPTREKIKEYRKSLKEVEKFVNEVYIKDVIEVARVYRNYFSIGKFTDQMSYGVFEENDELNKYMFEQGVFLGGNVEQLDTAYIKEQVKYSRYRSGSNLHPLKGQTDPYPGKAGAYTWLKAPRYKDRPVEVGPLARVAVSYLSGNEQVKREVDAVRGIFSADVSALFSVLGRHAARAIECKLLCQKAKVWLDELEVGGSPRNHYEIPDQGEGEGLTEAPRGALGHWIVVKDKKIANYQCVVPTTWYCGPRDDRGVLGPVEQALVGTPISDPANPIEAARVVRSFDPCIACAVHIVEGDREISKFRVC